ncbi:unnamed protein product, partial [Alternaria alternata]
MDAHSVLHTSTLGGISSSVYPEDHIVQKTADPEIRKLMNLFESLNFEMRSYGISTDDNPQVVYDIVVDEHISITHKTRAL